MRPIMGHIVGRDATVTARGEEPSRPLITAIGQAIYPRATVLFLLSLLLRLRTPFAKSFLTHTHLAPCTLLHGAQESQRQRARALQEGEGAA